MNKFQSDILKILPQKWNNEKIVWEELLEIPTKSSHGDYAFACFRLAKLFKTQPQKLAEDICKKLKKTPLISKIEREGAYINFYVNREELISFVLPKILEEKEKYGSAKGGQNKTVIVEYSSPNIAKPFHFGHLRSTIIGQSLCNIYNFLGYKTIAINHLGDWGTQFGKIIYAFKEWGNEKDYKNSGVDYLNSLYVQFHQKAKENPDIEDHARLWFSKCEEGDEEALKLWHEFKEKSLASFEKIYHRLGVKFDEILGESFYIDKIPDVLKELEKKKLLSKSEGALIVDLSKYDMPPCLLKKKDGSTLYATRDLACAIYRHKKYKFDQMVYVVAQDQTLHFKQIIKVLELMGHEWATSIVHLPFGLVGFKEGKMSTREGRVILLEDALDQAKQRVLKNIAEKNPDLENKEEVSEQVGKGAIIFSDVSQKMIKNVTFDWDDILSFEGETGPYLQYSFARASSILRKSTEKQKINIDFSVLKEEHEFQLVKTLFYFPDFLELTIKHQEPSILAHYLLDVAKTFNRFYLNHKVIVPDLKLHQARLSLVAATCQTLGNGLRLLNIETPYEM